VTKVSERYFENTSMIYGLYKIWLQCSGYQHYTKVKV